MVGCNVSADKYDKKTAMNIIFIAVFFLLSGYRAYGIHHFRNSIGRETTLFGML